MNNTFKIFYGIDSADIQPTVMIMPFDIPEVAAHLKVDRWIKGRMFACAKGQGFTLIRSGMGAGFVGDCILRLDQTPCRKILFLGTCGLMARAGNLDIGSLVTPAIVYAMESFSEILTGEIRTPSPITADQRLIPASIPRVNCVSFASLYLETRYTDVFKELNADVIEMECAAFCLAADRINRTSSSLLVCSDIIGDPAVCFNLTSNDKNNLTEGIQQACDIAQTMSKVVT
ncbi:MAG: hypothetical protein V2A70_05135 [Candidatus Omnitrophota bacterium]